MNRTVQVTTMVELVVFPSVVLVASCCYDRHDYCLLKDESSHSYRLDRCDYLDQNDFVVETVVDYMMVVVATGIENESLVVVVVVVLLVVKSFEMDSNGAWEKLLGSLQHVFALVLETIVDVVVVVSSCAFLHCGSGAAVEFEYDFERQQVVSLCHY